MYSLTAGLADSSLTHSSFTLQLSLSNHVLFIVPSVRRTAYIVNAFLSERPLESDRPRSSEFSTGHIHARAIWWKGLIIVFRLAFCTSALASWLATPLVVDENGKRAQMDHRNEASMYLCCSLFRGYLWLPGAVFLVLLQIRMAEACSSTRR